MEYKYEINEHSPQSLWAIRAIQENGTTWVEIAQCKYKSDAERIKAALEAQEPKPPELFDSEIGGIRVCERPRDMGWDAMPVFIAIGEGSPTQCRWLSWHRLLRLHEILGKCINHIRDLRKESEEE